MRVPEGESVELAVLYLFARENIVRYLGAVLVFTVLMFIMLVL